jgi:hypothetical protein
MSVSTPPPLDWHIITILRSWKHIAHDPEADWDMQWQDYINEPHVSVLEIRPIDPLNTISTWDDSIGCGCRPAVT